jgi:peroxiredoxin
MLSYFLATAALIAPDSSVSSLREELHKLKMVHAAAVSEYSKENEAANDAKTREIAAGRYKKSVEATVASAFALLDSHTDDPDVIPVLGFIITVSRGSPGSEKAIQYLHEHCVMNEGAGSVCHKIFYFFDLPNAEAFLRSVAERNPHLPDRALACHALSFYLRHKARMVRRLKQFPEKCAQFVTISTPETVRQIVADTGPQSLDDEAVTLLQRVIAEYGHVQFDGRSLGDIATGELFQMEHLSVGKVAPDISGTTIDGETLRLSDYEGSVVLLMFSGEWCGNCVAMYPEINNLIDELAGRPFVVLCVNTDQDTDHLRESMTSGKIRWKCWCDGGTTGPITTQWGVAVYPTIFLFDSHRVIRYTEVRSDSLRPSVISLVSEITKESSAD